MTVFVPGRALGFLRAVTAVRVAMPADVSEVVVTEVIVSGNNEFK